MWFTNGPRREKTCLQGAANNKGADQPEHPGSLISAFVVPLLESTISRPATSEISIFLLVSVAEETGLKLALWETPKTGFVAQRPIFSNVMLWHPNQGSINNDEILTFSSKKKKNKNNFRPEFFY